MNRRETRSHRTRRGGFSAVELVISVIIIGLLVAVAFPLLTQRSKEARINAARSDLEHLANAQERVALDTGYMVRLFALDDSAESDSSGQRGLQVPNDPTDHVDSIYDEANALYYNVNVLQNLFIDRQTQDFISTGAASGLWTQLVGNQSNYMALGPVWRGPHITWNRDQNVPNFVPASPGETGLDDIPNDPWGNNYLFFTRRGILNEPEGQFATEITAADTQGVDATAPGARTYAADVFDRPTVLTMGPDGVPGDANGPNAPENTFGTGDDLFRQW